MQHVHISPGASRLCPNLPGPVLEFLPHLGRNAIDGRHDHGFLLVFDFCLAVRNTVHGVREGAYFFIQMFSVGFLELRLLLVDFGQSLQVLAGLNGVTFLQLENLKRSEFPHRQFAVLWKV